MSVSCEMQSDGDDVFIRGLQQYLRSNEFSTGSSHKLWEAVAQVAGLPITRWMEQWTYHGGFPLVSATLQGSQVTVSQVSQPAVEKKRKEKKRKEKKRSQKRRKEKKRKEVKREEKRRKEKKRED